MNRIAVIDYGMGNLHSVAKAMEYVAREINKSTEVLITSDAQKISTADRVISLAWVPFGIVWQKLIG